MHPSLENSTFSLSIPVDNREATWKKATNIATQILRVLDDINLFGIKNFVLFPQYSTFKLSDN